MNIISFFTPSNYFSIFYSKIIECMFVYCEYLSLYYKFVLYMYECVFNTNCVCYFLFLFLL